jgi:hypothetical protein
MDSAQFIRSRSVLAAWLAAPLLLALIAEFGASGFREFGAAAYKRDAALQHLIPQMMAEMDAFGRIIKSYEPDISGGRTAEDIHIALLNETAAKAGFVITSLSVVSEPVGAAAQQIERLNITLKGFSSGSSAALFLRLLREKDPLIYEHQVLLTRTSETEDVLQMEAVLRRVCIAPAGKGDRE